MGLYRNIAGFSDSDIVGLTLLDPTYAKFQPTVVELSPTSATDFRDLLDIKLQNTADIQAKIWAAKNEKYDYLLNNSYEQITNEGYYVTTDNGSIFKWTDKAAGDSVAVLAIQDIQDIENARGTAGALLLHFNQPLLAKDTAGYAGGGSASSGSTTQYSDPIPEVKEIPDQGLPDGAVPFDPVIEIPVPNTEHQTTATTQTPTNTTDQKNPSWLPIITIGGLMLVALAGEKIFKKKRGLVFIGGLGALYYQFSKKT